MKLLYPLIILSAFFISCSTEPEDCAGIEGGTAEVDDCGVCDGDGSTCDSSNDGCMAESACNYNAAATEDDGSCSGDCSDECFRNNTACTPNYYLLESVATGVTQLTILVDTIVGLQRGDEIGIFDFNGVLNYNDCSNQIGEILVGSGVWKSEQLEIVSISSVDMCALGGVQLAGYVEGNLVLVKVYRPSTGVEYNAELTWSNGTGNFGDIIQSVSEISLSF